MSVESYDIIYYGSANMQEDDTSTPQGGAVDRTRKVTFAKLESTGTLSIVAEDIADTSISVTVTGRDGTGALVSEALVTDGSSGRTEVTGSQSFERILKSVRAAATPTGSIAIVSNSDQVTGAAEATTTVNQINLPSGVADYNTDDFYRGWIVKMTSGSAINQLREIVKHKSEIIYFRTMDATPAAADTFEMSVGMVLDFQPDGTNTIDECRRLFYNVAADPDTTEDYYEKFFVGNLNSATTLSNATIVEATSDLQAKITIAVEDALDDTGTSTNRKTAPASGFTAFGNGPIDFPNSKNFTAGSVCGIFGFLALSAGDTAVNSTYALQVNGQTT